MIDFGATQKELERVADSLVKDGDPISAGRIRQLIIAVGGDPSAEDWAATNIQSIIDPEAITNGIKSRLTPPRWIGVLEWLRNGLVLFPLILTWLGISLATQKYQALVNADKTQELHSFLYLWQGGFNHTLPAPFVLNNLAFADCILLATIFVLTLVTSLQHNIFTGQNEKRAELLRTSLSHALGDAALCLAMIHRQRQLNQPSNINDVAKYLYQFGEQFKQTTQKFLDEMVEERKRRGDLATFTAALDKMSKDMLTMASSIQQTNTNLNTTLQGILGPVKEIPRLVATAGQVIAEQQKMTGLLGQLVADQARWRQELQTVLANGLSQQLAEQKQATQTLNNTIGTLLSQQTAQQAKMSQDLYTMMDGSLTRLLAEQNKLSQEVIQAASTLETSSTNLGNVVQSLGKATTEQTQVLNVMQGLQAEQRRLTSEMTAATAEIKKVLSAVNDSAPDVRSMAVDIDKFVKALRRIPVDLNADLLAPLQQYSSAAAKVSAGSDTLGRAAQYLENVTKKLDGRLGP